MAKAGTRYWQRDMQVLTDTQVGVKGNFAERDYYLDMRQELELSEEVRLAIVDFLVGRFIRWGSTVEHLRDKAIVQPQAVVTMGGGGLAGKTMRVQRTVEPFSAAISSKGATGAVPSMRRWRQTEYYEACLWIAKTWDGLAPIGLMAKTTHFLHRHLVQVRNQARAEGTGDDAFLHLHYGQKCF